MVGIAYVKKVKAHMGVFKEDFVQVSRFTVCQDIPITLLNTGVYLHDHPFFLRKADNVPEKVVGELGNYGVGLFRPVDVVPGLKQSIKTLLCIVLSGFGKVNRTGIGQGTL